MMHSSIICSTYNSPHFLKIVLDSLLFQASQNFELIIADDGSTSETAELIKGFQEKAPFQVHHLWHEDKGWQKSQIHNKAIAKAKHDHLVFIDGDCILSPQFVSDHQKIFETEKENYVLMGRRVELGPDLTKKLTVQNYRNMLINFPSFGLVLSNLKKDSDSALRKMSVYSPFFRKLLKANNVHDLLGCNFSLNKKSMIQINGFNDSYERGEDGDIFIRLRNSGHKCIGMKYYAPMFHMFHSRGNYLYVDENYDRELKRTDYVWAENGLNKYLDV